MLFYFMLIGWSVAAISLARFVRWGTVPTTIVISFVLAVFVGFRAESVGTDTPAYFRHLSYWIGGFGNTFSFEPGLYYLFKVLSYLGVSGSYYFFVVSLLTMLFFSFGILRFSSSRVVPYAFIVFLITFFIYSFSGIRQVLAVSIVFFGLSYVDLEKGFKNYLSFGLIILACFVHNSVVLVLPVLLLTILWSSIRKTKIDIALFVVLLCVLIGLAVIAILGIYKNHLEHLEFSSGVGLTLYPRIFLYIFSLVIIFKVKGGVNRVGLLAFSFYSLGFFLSIPGYFIENVFRISYPFIVFEGLYYGRIMTFFPGSAPYLLGGLVLILNIFILSMDLIYDGRSLIPYEMAAGL